MKGYSRIHAVRANEKVQESPGRIYSKNFLHTSCNLPDPMPSSKTLESRLPDAVPGPRGVDVPDGPKGRLNAARHLPEEGVEAGHLLFVEDETAPREEGVPVAVHQHALHDRLRQVAGPGAAAVHLPHWTQLRLASQRGGTSAAPAASRHTRRGVAS
ncbi:hypothetical protein DBR06_SOUSAS20010070 [Sousa chinensis]|nr:hypothetical protein DBR06_SOUSAS20010070 [Sousa chinensis]